jgi:hypothetical protein
MGPQVVKAVLEKTKRVVKLYLGEGAGGEETIGDLSTVKRSLSLRRG